MLLLLETRGSRGQSTGVVLCPVWESSEAKGGWEVSAERRRTAGSRLGSGEKRSQGNHL